MKIKQILLVTLMIFLLNFFNCYGQEENTKPYKVLKGHEHKVQNAFFSSDGKYIISHGWDNTIKLWDAKTFSEIRTFTGHTDQVWCATISQDSKFIASGSMDRTFIIWDVETGGKMHQVQISPYNVIEKGMIPEWDGEIQNSIYKVKFSPNGKQLAIASADKLVRIWDMEKSVLTHSLDGQHFTNWMSVKYSPDGKYIISVSGSAVGTTGVKVIWETETYKQVRRIVMSGDILFTEHNELGIYTGNNSMNYYNLPNGELIRNDTFPDFKGNFSLSPDKKHMVSCNEDSFIILRNVKTQKVIWTYEHESLEIHNANFSPDGKYLITGTPESDILIWKVDDIINDL